MGGAAQAQPVPRADDLAALDATVCEAGAQVWAMEVLRSLGVEKVYVSNLGQRRAPARLRKLTSLLSR